MRCLEASLVICMVVIALGCNSEGESGSAPLNDEGNITPPADVGGSGGTGGGGGGFPGGFNPTVVFDESDKDKDGELKEDEMPGGMEDRFKSFDADQNGTVTREEFTKGVQNMMPAGMGGGPGGPGQPGGEAQRPH